MERIKEEIKKYICSCLLLNVEEFHEDVALFTSGRLDRHFQLFLLLEIENRYQIVFTDEEMDIECFNTIDSIAAKIDKKLQEKLN